MADSSEPGAKGDAALGTCAITGASGYVGSRVARSFAGAGWNVRALSRSPASAERDGYGWVQFDLGDELTPGALAGVEALVHVAYDFDATRWPDIQRINVEGSRKLFAAAREAHVERIVLISTVAAFPRARSLYGRAKLEIEREALGLGASVIRSGLVWGPQGAAMFGALQRLIERLPIVPLLVPGELEMSLVHEDDLALLAERLIEQWPAASGKLLVAASEQTPTFLELLRSLARAVDRDPRFLRLPWQIPWIGLRALEAVGLSPPFRSDSLLSLASADRDPGARATDAAEHYGVKLRPYALA